jgi:hypothetical protein
MDLAERNRLIAATKGFQHLRGLIYAPVGLANMAFSVLAHMDPQNPQSREASAGAFALYPFPLAASFAASVHYRRRFGVVRSKSRGLNVLLLTLATIVAVLTMWGAVWVDIATYEHPVSPYPVSFTCLWWALFYLACYLQPYRVRPHSLWFAALFLGLCFLTQMGVVPKSQFFALTGRAGDILIWVVFSVHGLLDHFLLLRLLPKASLGHAPAQTREQHD